MQMEAEVEAEQSAEMVRDGTAVERARLRVEIKDLY